MISTALDPPLDMNFAYNQASDDDSDDSDEDFDKKAIRGSADGQLEPTTESQILHSSILESITSLLKLSMFIRKSTRGKKFAESSRAQKYETQYDINHVRDRYPFASIWPHLVERLGKANAQRRQWLSYQRRNREKEAVLALIDEYETSLSSDAALGHNDEGPQQHKLAGKGLTKPSVWTEEHKDQYSSLSSTKASTIEEPEEIIGTGVSEMSCSETSFGGSEYETSLVPQLPPEAANQSPFECPYCFSIITVAGNSAWR
ncbi:MAG: hypothetical protein LQ349_008507 [Xanthoria aureola]|nr:MAG: hypothetical protein LQ349_008507 [Xanthoria aureola]